MSSRHQHSRRRSYGRRQHEVRERRERFDALAPDGLEPLPDEIRDAAVTRVVFLPRPVRWAEGAA